MTNASDEQKSFRTLRGFLSGEEVDEENRFEYSATLRIFGQNLDFEDISSHLGVQPTYSHRKGERKGKNSPPFEHDMWQYEPPLDEKIELAQHINALWAAIKPSKEYLLSLKKVATVDVFLGYRSNVDTAGVEVPHTSLEMFTELEIPFGLSIIIA
jgi:hypothetical protein